VLVGDYEHETFHTAYDEVRKRIQSLGLEKRVVLTAWLADEDLVALLNLATVLVLPSITEGFGLPAVEAAACGCPVIATTESPLPALLGEGGLYVDPRDGDQLFMALDRVLASPDLRARMRQAGLTAASRLTWTAAARDLLTLIEGARVAA
jgi:glycosyltransferase involved in cell wall biosynthesis